MPLGPSESFVDSLNKAREVPAGSQADFDMPQIFGPMPGAKDTAGAVGTKLPCVAHSKVFTIWRPWETCRRCIAAIEHGEVALPEDEDYTCPHTNEKAFKEALDKCLSGDAALQSKEFFNLPDGTRCGHITWMEADESSLRKLELADRAKEKNWVWPPRPDLAFADPVEAAKNAVGGSNSNGG